jgi:D-amino-acid dehydrogenase
VAIVGGGLIGLCSAFFLHRSGWRVTLLERDLLGSGASRGNAGMVVQRAKPLAAPGIVKDGVRHLFAETGAFYVNPRALLSVLPFLVRFAVRSNDRTFQRSVDAMDILNRRSGDMFDILRSEQIGTRVNREGSLLVYKDRGQAASARDRIAAAARANPHLVTEPGPLLGGTELRELEPMLGASARWGILLRHVWWVDPNSFVDELVDWIQRQEITVMQGCEVLDIVEHVNGVRVLTSAGELTADDSVVCAGAWSGALVKRLGARVHIAPGKGYSFSIDPDTRDSHRCVSFQDIHVVSVPLRDGRVRFAGTMELDGRHGGINPGRVEAITYHLRDYVAADLDQRQDVWAGPRPMTPDGIPYIGRVGSRQHVFVASGHNMEGLSLAPATGSLVADLLNGQPEASSVGGLSPRRAGGLKDLISSRRSS